MQQFSIKAMERLSGIKAHTLRIWEKRYGILQPMRLVGNHRNYSNEDLKILLRIVFLYEKGHRIGEIARLSDTEMQQLLELEHHNGNSTRANILAMLAAIMGLEEDEMDKMFMRITRQYGFGGAMLDIVFPLLSQLGHLWMSDRIQPVQEHFASNFIIRKTLVAKNEIAFNPLPIGESILLFTPKGEHHEIGLLYMSYLLRLNGFNTVYIGTNADMQTIDMYFQRCRPTHFFVYLTGNLQDKDPEEYLGILVKKYPEARVVAGGVVVKEIKEIPGCKILRNGVEMLQFSRHLHE